jgi:hypothetical protein
MNQDPRCCGSGTCIIDADGRCWCGQQWNGQEMCAPGRAEVASAQPQIEAADSTLDHDQAAATAGVSGPQMAFQVR